MTTSKRNPSDDKNQIEPPDFRRKHPTIADRRKPCEWCNHPLSQRHHLLPFKTYGENHMILHLCANCHEIYHVMESWYHNSVRGIWMKIALESGLGEKDHRIIKAKEAVKKASDEMFRLNGGTKFLPIVEVKKQITQRKFEQAERRKRRDKRKH